MIEDVIWHRLTFATSSKNAGTIYSNRMENIVSATKTHRFLVSNFIYITQPLLASGFLTIERKP